MACDRQMTQGNSLTWKCKTKIFQFPASEVYPEDYIVGFAGTANEMLDCVDYFNDPEQKPPSLKHTNGLVLTRDGNIYVFDRITHWLFVEAPFAAIGNGSMYALGALSHGASPKEAVKAAEEHDPFTGMGIKVISW